MRKLSGIILVSAALLYGTDISEVGFNFLKINKVAGARAMAGAGTAKPVLSSHWYSNPAGVYREESYFYLSHMLWLQDTHGNLISYGLAGKKFYLSLTFDHLYVPDIPFADEFGHLNPASNFSMHDIAVGITCGIPYKDMIFGITGKVLQEMIYTERCNGFAVDAGLIKKDLIPNLDLGLSLHNLGRSDLYLVHNVPLPSLFRAGLSYSRKIGGRNMVTLLADFQKQIFISSFDYSDTTDVNEKLITTFPLGAEFNYKDFLFLRAGAALNDPVQLFGTGFNIRFSRYSFDYSFCYYREELGHPHIAGLTFHF
jgi:hypothetical protein